MHRHEVDADHFLNTVHAIDNSPVEAHPDLVAAIRALPGRKFILTNGDTGHAPRRARQAWRGRTCSSMCTTFAP